MDPLRAPELARLPAALTLASIAEQRAERGWVPLVLAGLGSAVEGVLSANLFGPYLDDVGEGHAEPSPALQVTGGRSLTLGVMCRPWGRLVVHWEGHDDSRPVARWLEMRWPLAGRLHDPTLNTLNEVHELRNSGAHFRAQPSGLQSVRRMLALLLDGPAPILVRLYEAMRGTAIAA